MTRPSPISLLCVALSLACATSPAATPPTTTPAPVATQAALPPVVTTTAALNPVGTFDFTATLPDGSESNGSFTITGSPGTYAGTIERAGEGGTELTRITVDGQTLTIGANISDGAVVLTLDFTGNDFSGKWALGDLEGPIKGKRR